MTAKEWIKQNVPHSSLFENGGPLATEITVLMEEYGKYCAKEAYNQAIADVMDEVELICDKFGNVMISEESILKLKK